MGRESIPPSPTLGRLLRARRQELRLGLNEVSAKIQAVGHSLPASTLASIERGEADPGVRRLCLLLRLYDLPAEMITDAIEIEELAAPLPAEKDPDVLLRKGVEFWKQGDFAQGMAHVLALREQVPHGPKGKQQRQKALLTFAIAVQSLGKYRLARRVVDDLLCEPPDSSLLPNVLMVAADLWVDLGSTEAALGFLARAEHHIPRRDVRLSAMLLHQRGKTRFRAGDRGAGADVGAAIQRYRKLGDSANEARAQLLAVRIAAAHRSIGEAIALSRDAIVVADSNGHPGLAAYLRLELGALLHKAQQFADSLEPLQAALGQTVLMRDRPAEFLAHYRLYKAYQALSDRARAAVEREAARYYARFVEEPYPELEEFRAPKPETPGGTPHVLRPKGRRPRRR